MKTEEEIKHRTAKLLDQLSKAENNIDYYNCDPYDPGVIQTKEDIANIRIKLKELIWILN